MSMTHVNIKPAERTRVYETAEQAITHIFLYGVHAPQWDYGGKPFGQTIEDRRRIANALKTKDRAAFVAYKRRGYWRVELA